MKKYRIIINNLTNEVLCYYRGTFYFENFKDVNLGYDNIIDINEINIEEQILNLIPLEVKDIYIIL